MADYKDKINEVRDSVKDAAANIASDENKQKLTDAADAVAKKAKGLNKKTIAVIAVALVAVIVLVFKIGGGSSKAEKVLKTELENKYHYSVSNIKEEFKDSFKVQSVTQDGNFEKADLFVMSCETEVGNNPNSHRYGIYTVMLYADGSNVVHFEADCSSKKEFKGWLNQVINSHKASIKQQKKDKAIK